MGATEKKRHISHALRRNEERENPTDFPRGMQIRIEISRENVKDPMRFVRVAARCERRAVGNNYQKSSLSSVQNGKGRNISREKHKFEKIYVLSMEGSNRYYLYPFY